MTICVQELKKQMLRAKCDPVEIERFKNGRVRTSFKDLLEETDAITMTTSHVSLANAITNFQEVGDHLDSCEGV